MTVLICSGCGRRAGSEEVHCAACGRPLAEGDVTPPPGWMTADAAADEPLVRPEAVPSQQEAELSPEATAALFVPISARRAEAAAVPSPEGADEPIGGAAPVVTSTLPGGHGWRVRVSEAQRAAGAADDDGLAARRRGPRRLPRWVFAALIVAILATSSAAALLIVIHVMHGN